MKIVHLNSSECHGGAARAALRIHSGLIECDIASKIVVKNKVIPDEPICSTNNPFVKFYNLATNKIDNVPVCISARNRLGKFSIGWIGNSINKSYIADADIINVHWITDGFLSINQLAKIDKPIVWVLHDMWPFTGGCHYDNFCGKFSSTCGRCPVLNSNSKFDLSYWNQKRKIKILGSLKIHVVAVSGWIARKARESSLFGRHNITVIPNCVDTTVFKPIDKKVSRKAWNLPEKKKLILFGAVNATVDKRKGYEHLKCATDLLREKGLNDFELVIFGRSSTDEPLNVRTKIHDVGFVKDDVSLACLYSAADVMVVPSLQEAFGLTALEALSCGTPVVCFKDTGVEDIVEHRETGYIARAFDEEDLAIGIVWGLEKNYNQQGGWNKSSVRAKEKFETKIIAKKYIELYESILYD
ncbi:glycosyltransferase involved in cell wall biosynthesis [Geothermobacter ehrlichii]|uniref:Glycosyltransferase involved in cell wall biosynthesis n=1 Tax=Geothermobacter ehrlichii TaxID=213224 RepID=A0A5D3WJJ5_9BACT|nr:glycosyltransferase family 4 protein [Geothermobacter ehrlichii]TYO98358.1 glycosyltransferase involved in cell wall biosynthesis [Geothermobacter ehrlichii]